jgi:hypothetical protein
MALNKTAPNALNETKKYRDLSIVISLVFLLEVLTYKDFFFLNPADATSTLIALQRTLFDLGWVSFMFFTPLTLSLSLTRRLRNRMFLISWIIWPSSLIFIHLSSLFTDQNLYLDYLINYPIFIFTDVLAPAFYFWVWFTNRTKKGN